VTISEIPYMYRCTFKECKGTVVPPQVACDLHDDEETDAAKGRAEAIWRALCEHGAPKR